MQISQIHTCTLDCKQVMVNAFEKDFSFTQDFSRKNCTEYNSKKHSTNDLKGSNHLEFVKLTLIKRRKNNNNREISLVLINLSLHPKNM